MLWLNLSFAIVNPVCFWDVVPTCGTNAGNTGTDLYSEWTVQIKLQQWTRCHVTQSWMQQVSLILTCFQYFFSSLSRSVQMGLLASRWRSCRVPLRGSDQPGSHLLPGFHHPATLHDPRGPAGRLHRQGQCLQEREQPEGVSRASLKSNTERFSFKLCLCVCSTLRISSTRPHCWSCRRCSHISWWVYCAASDWSKHTHPVTGCNLLEPILTVAGQDTTWTVWHRADTDV